MDGSLFVQVGGARILSNGEHRGHLQPPSAANQFSVPLVSKSRLKHITLTMKAESASSSLNWKNAYVSMMVVPRAQSPPLVVMHGKSISLVIRKFLLSSSVVSNPFEHCQIWLG